MWFNQLSFYRTNSAQMPTAEAFELALHKMIFKSCLGLDWFSEGWDSCSQNKNNLLLDIQKSWQLSLKREDKVLPSAVIRDFLDDKVMQLENQELRKLSRKEKQALKEQITDDLLPKAFTRSSHLSAIINHQRNWLMVNSTTTSKVDSLLSCLREALPSFPASLVHTNLSAQVVMTDWLLAGEASNGFSLDSDCELKASTENGAIIRCSKQDLTSDEIQHHLKNGKQATKLGLVWQDKISFILTENLQLKRIQFLDVLQEEAAQAGDDIESLNKATLLLNSEELGALLDDLLVALGGQK